MRIGVSVAQARTTIDLAGTNRHLVVTAEVLADVPPGGLTRICHRFLYCDRHSAADPRRARSTHPTVRLR